MLSHRPSLQVRIHPHSSPPPLLSGHRLYTFPGCKIPHSEKPPLLNSENAATSCLYQKAAVRHTQVTPLFTSFVIATRHELMITTSLSILWQTDSFRTRMSLSDWLCVGCEGGDLLLEPLNDIKKAVLTVTKNTGSLSALLYDNIRQARKAQRLPQASSALQALQKLFKR